MIFNSSLEVEDGNEGDWDDEGDDGGGDDDVERDGAALVPGDGAPRGLGDGGVGPGVAEGVHL